MARLKAVNDAISALAVELLAADNHMHITAGHGVSQAFPTAGDWMMRIAETEDFEIIRATLRPSTTHPGDVDTINITRSQEGTTAPASWPVGTPVWIAITRGYLDELQAELDTHTTLGAQSEVRLTPKATSAGPEGTVFYDSDDDHLWVGTE